MKNLLYLAVGILLAAVAGCTVGPDYHRPVSKLADQWATPLAGGETNHPPSDAAWWTTFNDAELNSLVERAVSSNLNLRIATARVREARAARTYAAAGFWPTADSQLSYNRQRLSENGFPPFPAGTPLDWDIYQLGFDATWELDVFGRTRRTVQAADAGVQALEANRRGTVVSLLGEVARNYIEARAFQRRLAIAHNNIRAQQDVVDLTRNRYQAGLSGDLDVQQATALLATTQSQIPSLESGFNQAAYSLAVLLGQPPGSVTNELAMDAPIPATPPEVPAGLPSELLLRRPDIQSAERQLAANTAAIGIAIADLYPRFSLTGAAGLQSVTLGDWFTAGSRFWDIGPTVQWRIFDAGRIRANIRLQNARQEEALASYEQTVLSAMQDVEMALTAYAKEQIRRQSLQQAFDASRQALQISEQLYQNGLTDFLRVLEAQRSLYSNEDALAQSDRTIALDLVTLYKALGGGWQITEQESKK